MRREVGELSIFGVLDAIMGLVRICIIIMNVSVSCLP